MGIQVVRAHIVGLSYEGASEFDMVQWGIRAGAAGYTQVATSEFTLVATKPSDLRIADLDDYVVITEYKPNDEDYTFEDIDKDKYDIDEDMDITVIVPIAGVDCLEGDTTFTIPPDIR